MSSDEEHQFEFEDDMELNGEDDSEMEYDDEDELDSDAEEELEEDLQAFSRSKVQEQREFIFDKVQLVLGYGVMAFFGSNLWSGTHG
jgi:hypothetical protein